jgi:hypothetical protein
MRNLSAMVIESAWHPAQSGKVLRKGCRASNAWAVSMLVYIDTAWLFQPSTLIRHGPSFSLSLATCFMPVLLVMHTKSIWLPKPESTPMRWSLPYASNLMTALQATALPSWMAGTSDIIHPGFYIWYIHRSTTRAHCHSTTPYFLVLSGCLQLLWACLGPLQNHGTYWQWSSQKYRNVWTHHWNYCWLWPCYGWLLAPALSLDLTHTPIELNCLWLPFWYDFCSTHNSILLFSHAWDTLSLIW